MPAEKPTWPFSLDILMMQPESCSIVIMPFCGDAVLDTYYEEAIAPTVSGAGLRCVRVDREQFIGEISDEIRRGIEESSVVIADLTLDRPNCYFEAGYAVAKGRPIIFQRLDAPQYRSPIPFDLKDYPHILYKTAAHLRAELEKRLSAVLANVPAAP